MPLLSLKNKISVFPSGRISATTQLFGFPIGVRLSGHLLQSIGLYFFMAILLKIGIKIVPTTNLIDAAFLSLSIL
jgi:hypothetical protein